MSSLSSPARAMVSSLARSRSPMCGLKMLRAIRCDTRSAGLLLRSELDYAMESMEMCGLHVSVLLRFSFFFCAHAAHHKTGQHQLITCGKKREEQEFQRMREKKRQKETTNERENERTAESLDLSPFDLLIFFFAFSAYSLWNASSLWLLPEQIFLRGPAALQSR